jgi:hypothetical protein
MVKGSTKGRYICKVGFLDVYAMEAIKKQSGKGDNKEVASTTYQIVHGKKIKERGLKNKDMAVEKALELLGDKRVNYGL